MAKQKIEMQELPAGVFTFDEIGKIINHSKYDSLLAITSVESYNNRLNVFPLTVLDLENIPDLVLTKAERFVNLEDPTSSENDLSAYNEKHILKVNRISFYSILKRGSA